MELNCKVLSKSINYNRLIYSFHLKFEEALHDDQHEYEL
jgi:hypothetical protein